MVSVEEYDKCYKNRVLHHGDICYGKLVKVRNFVFSMVPDEDYCGIPGFFRVRKAENDLNSTYILDENCGSCPYFVSQRNEATGT